MKTMQILKLKQASKSVRPIFKIEKNKENNFMDLDKLKEQLFRVFTFNDQVYNSLIDASSYEDTLFKICSPQYSSTDEININQINFLGSLQVATFLDSMNKIYNKWNNSLSNEFTEQELKLLGEAFIPNNN